MLAQYFNWYWWTSWTKFYQEYIQPVYITQSANSTSCCSLWYYGTFGTKYV